VTARLRFNTRAPASMHSRIAEASSPGVALGGRRFRKDRVYEESAVRADGRRRGASSGAENARNESPMSAGGAGGLRALGARFSGDSADAGCREIRVADGDRAVDHPHHDLRPPQGEAHQLGEA
jgi:hypothetical protein